MGVSDSSAFVWIQHVTVGVVGGSDLVKISEQLGKTSKSLHSNCCLHLDCCLHLITVNLIATRRLMLAGPPDASCVASQPFIFLQITALTDFDYVFAENGLVAFKDGTKFAEMVRLVFDKTASTNCCDDSKRVHEGLLAISMSSLSTELDAEVVSAFPPL